MKDKTKLKTERIAINLTKSEMLKLEIKAKQSHQTVMNYVRNLVREVIKEASNND